MPIDNDSCFLAAFSYQYQRSIIMFNKSCANVESLCLGGCTMIGVRGCDKALNYEKSDPVFDDLIISC